MVIVVALAAVDAESVMLLPPANTIRVPELMPVSPEVLPTFESATFRMPCVCTVYEFTLNWNWLPVVERMVIAPSSERPTVPEVNVVFEFDRALIPV